MAPGNRAQLTTSADLFRWGAMSATFREISARARAALQGALALTLGGIAPALRGGAMALVCVGCAHGPETPVTPEETVAAFARALNQNKFEEAYALMSEDYRARVGFDQFKRQLSENPQELLEIGHALSHARAPAQEQAVIGYDDDEQLQLRRVGDRWFISSNVVDFYDQKTPRAALRSFVRAMERKRYDVVMRLIPETDKEGITADRMEQAWSGEEREQVERMLSTLREHLDAPIEVVGTRATMPYGEHMRVQFVREGSLWKIEDPE
jgi:hypothetical protein